jgi:uncharacterized protein
MSTRLVLDTNIWLDWLVFVDPSVTGLKSAVKDGRVQIAMDQACFEELRRVLHYPEFSIPDSRRESLLELVRAQTISADSSSSGAMVRLPRCKDPDDQKFLELAHRTNAGWLLSRDRGLLKFGSRKRRLSFSVGTPADWEMARTPELVPPNPSR